MDEDDTAKLDNNEPESELNRKVFIGSLSYRIDENTFHDYWTQFGTVLDARILRDREGNSRGFGFVTFDNSSSVDALMKARPHTLDNRIVETKRAVPRDQSHKPDTQSAVKKVYVGGIKEPLTETDLKDYFSKYGSVTDAIVMKNRDGQYRGFGFIEFDDYDSVDKIVLEKHHIVCGHQLDVQKAQSKDATQRSNSNMRSQQGPPSRSNYNNSYDNYQQNSFDRPNNNYEHFGGPMRRGNTRGSGRGYAPYNTRGRNQGSSWTAWD